MSWRYSFGFRTDDDLLVFINNAPPPLGTAIVLMTIYERIHFDRIQSGNDIMHSVLIYFYKFLFVFSLFLIVNGIWGVP